MGGSSGGSCGGSSGGGRLVLQLTCGVRDWVEGSPSCCAAPWPAARGTTGEASTWRCVLDAAAGLAASGCDRRCCFKLQARLQACEQGGASAPPLRVRCSSDERIVGRSIGLKKADQRRKPTGASSRRVAASWLHARRRPLPFLSSQHGRWLQCKEKLYITLAARSCRYAKQGGKHQPPRRGPPRQRLCHPASLAPSAVEPLLLDGRSDKAHYHAVLLLAQAEEQLLNLLPLRDIVHRLRVR